MKQKERGTEISPKEVKILARNILFFAQCRLRAYKGGRNNNDLGTTELVSFMHRILNSEECEIFVDCHVSREEANRKESRKFLEQQNHVFVRRTLVTCTLLYSSVEISILRDLIENAVGISDERKMRISEAFFKA